MLIAKEIQLVSSTFPKEKLQEIIEKTRPFVKGHFLYPADTNGPHSHLPGFFYFSRLVSLQEAISLIAEDLIRWLERERIDPDVLFAPADPAVKMVVDRFSAILRKPAAYLEYLPTGRFGEKIERGELLQGGKNVFVFNGVSTTGRCVGVRLPGFVEKSGGEVSAIAAFAKGTAPGVKAAEEKYGDHFYSAIQVDIPMYPPGPNECPLCKEGIPLQNWNAGI